MRHIREEDTAIPETLNSLFFSPITRLNEYARLLLKLAMCFEVVSACLNFVYFSTDVMHSCKKLPIDRISVKLSQFPYRHIG